MTIDVADSRWNWDVSDWPFPALLDIYKGAADLANGGALVIGDEIPGWRDLDLASTFLSAPGRSCIDVAPIAWFWTMTERLPVESARRRSC